MKVKQIILHNVMGIKDLEVTPGQVTVISGKNATGKTSIMAGIAAVINGGHDAFLLRNGQSEGEAVIVFDDDTTLTKKFDDSKSNVTVSIEGRNLSSPAKYIKDLFGSGFNPVTFLTMNDKDRVTELLKNINITLDQTKLAQITGESKITGVDYFQHPLKVIDAISKVLYDTRTGVNRIVTDTESTIKTIKSSLIEVDDSIPADIALFENDKLDIQVQLSTHDAMLNKALQEVNDQRDAAIEKIRKDAEDKREELRKVHDNNVAEIRTKERTVLTKLAELSEKQDLADKQEYVKEQIKDLEIKSKTNNSESLRLSTALDKLKEYKQALADSIKIAGHSIGIVDGSLFVDDLPYAKLNTAAKIEVSMAIAEQNLGKARFVVIDGAEALDEDSLALLAKEADKQDVQLLMFAVSESNILKATEITPSKSKPSI